MSVDLERWECPRCNNEADVWLEDDEPEVELIVVPVDGLRVRVNRKTHCPACFADSMLVPLRRPRAA